MRVSTSGDPRLEAMFGGGNFSEASARPVVAIGRNRMPAWVFVAIAGVAALLLFLALESRRTAPDQQEAVSKTAAFPMDPPPPLSLPPQYGADSLGQIVPLQVSPPSTRPAPTVIQPFAPVIGQSRSAPPPVAPARSPFPGQQGGMAMVIDTGGPSGPASPTGALNAAAAGASPFQVGAPAARVRATSLANPSYTVPQGVLIPAVLETAFHSTSAGFARAIVARDVRGFDGTKVLIPRGSRLIGEYRGSVGPSQNRAVINWTRLIRGDGVTISLSSPAVDPLGRGGVRARVNDHLVERITNSLLQSTVGMAGSLLRSNRSSVVVAVPGAVDSASEGMSVGETMRTLSVPAGTSISVFVAQDLEFQDETGQP
jgi:type IV secretion system protein VirB10